MSLALMEVVIWVTHLCVVVDLGVVVVVVTEEEEEEEVIGGHVGAVAGEVVLIDTGEY